MPAGKNVLAGIGAVCLVLAALVILYLTTGLYNVGADSEHTGLMHLALAAVRERSVDAHAEDVTVPRLDNPKMIADGASDYDEMCTVCHLAPGMAENEMRPGMNPKPPVLAKDPPDSPAEAFWVIKHGIKMTGMPAWGVTHTDAEIWNIVAFLNKLPTLSPQAYRALVASAAGHHAHDEHPDHMAPRMKM
jgi:mono/diheme cytochrome c family protein